MAALYEYARGRLGPAKAPRRIAVAAELPLTPTGKIAKNSLPALIQALAVPESGLPGGGETQERIGRIWEAVLDQPVTPASDFLDLGGTSLEAAEITVRVRRELGKAAREEDVYRAGTLAEYAQARAGRPPARRGGGGSDQAPAEEDDMTAEIFDASYLQESLYRSAKDGESAVNVGVVLRLPRPPGRAAAARRDQPPRVPP